ncbi:MAG: DUF4442 domain-containing protein [Bacteroidia bacterium]|nr:DUF4442 domain-containing protein [Bacteroidia bacterium]
MEQVLTPETTLTGQNAWPELDPRPIEYIRNNALNGFKFRLMLLGQLPMGFLCGMKIKELSDSTAKVTVPYKWLNKNPFRSTFWAVLGMAAEMSSGIFLMMYTYKQKPSVATLVVENSAKYYKKATGRTTFVFEGGMDIKNAIRQTMATGEPIEVVCPMKGFNDSGELLVEYSFTWSFKARKK